MHANLNIDPKYADQQLRTAMTLPNGNGKITKIAVLTNENNFEAAKKADLDSSPVIQSSLKSILQGITSTAKSLDQASQSLTQILSSIEAGGLSIKIIDGYVAGATVLVDANGNGKADTGEFVGKTDATGTVALTSDIAELSQDAIDAALTAGTGITKTYNDSTNTLTIAVDTTAIQAKVANVDDTEIGYLNGVTSAIQTQLDDKSTASGLANDILEFNLLLIVILFGIGC